VTLAAHASSSASFLAGFSAGCGRFLVGKVDLRETMGCCQQATAA
jgi:hypothetical protein